MVKDSRKGTTIDRVQERHGPSSTPRWQTGVDRNSSSARIKAIGDEARRDHPPNIKVDRGTRRRLPRMLEKRP